MQVEYTFIHMQMLFNYISTRRTYLSAVFERRCSALFDTFFLNKMKLLGMTEDQTLPAMDLSS